MTLLNAAAAPRTLVIPLTKIDVEKRLVYGVAAAEIRDQAGEVMDYASAKPAFASWSKSFEDATGGLSKGNLREMHNPKMVAGRLDQLGFDDDGKRIEVCAKVTDDQAWKKCLDGCYTGFSVGGGYGPKWTDDAGNKRYTPIVRELSLVDNPCIPTARFAELVKAHGVVEQLELRGSPLTTFATAWAARPRTFAEQWDGRLRSFGDLHKAWDESKHPRDHGKFASEGGSSDRDDDYEARRWRAGIIGGVLGTVALPVPFLGTYAGYRLGRALVSRGPAAGHTQQDFDDIAQLEEISRQEDAATARRYMQGQTAREPRPQQHNPGGQARYRERPLPPNSRAQNATRLSGKQLAVPVTRAHPVQTQASMPGRRLPPNDEGHEDGAPFRASTGARGPMAAQMPRTQQHDTGQSASNPARPLPRNDLGKNWAGWLGAQAVSTVVPGTTTLGVYRSFGGGKGRNPSRRIKQPKAPAAQTDTSAPPADTSGGTDQQRAGYQRFQQTQRSVRSAFGMRTKGWGAPS
jgi:hypothetical protein